MHNDHQILILGEPDSGKTHFGGQLIHRLKSQGNAFEMSSPPDDYEAFLPVLEALSGGKSVGHTQSSFRKSQKIKIKSAMGFETHMVFPDYAGEKVRELVGTRRLDNEWMQQISASGHWVLILSLKDQPAEEDITNHPNHSLEVIPRTNEYASSPKLVGQSFYIELLQMLLFKKVVDNTQAISSPRLTVLLSLWDILNLEGGALPVDVIRKKMPLFLDFLQSNWQPDSLHILGLSSLGKELQVDRADDDYQDLGCTEFGYLVLENGDKNQDLTRAIHFALGTPAA
jgi:Double-GTPase 1